MSRENRTYIAIDLKAFYASVECAARGLDPLKTNLVVADPSRTQKTICLAVSPSLKAWGISGRARLFEVYSRVCEVNALRAAELHGKPFSGESYDATEIDSHIDKKVSFLIAPPRMAQYMKVSTDIYKIYTRYISPEDIQVYSIDEVFIDATGYLKTYQMTPHELTMMLIRAVLKETGITATAGIGTNLYLCKVAMDIIAKHKQPDADGVRIAEIDERAYRELLWNHRPLSDFWRVGRKTEQKLGARGIHTMGDIARCSLGGSSDFYSEDLLYSLFGVNAELLIDHAWGYEPTTIDLIRKYRPKSSSKGSGQVLMRPYAFDEARIVLREMTEDLVIAMVRDGITTDQIVVTIGYDKENLEHPIHGKGYRGETTTDGYGRRIPHHAHGSANLQGHTSSGEQIVHAALSLFDRIVDPNLTIRRITVNTAHIQSLEETEREREMAMAKPKQLSMFDSLAEGDGGKSEEEKRKQEERLQDAVLKIQTRYGKNALLKGTSYREGATQRERNKQIGGHKA